jgi:Cyclin M transmembrane N-terminal domain
MSGVVSALMWITSPISWPLSKVLDAVLGGETTTRFRRKQLKALVTVHAEQEGFGGTLSEDEIQIIAGKQLLRHQLQNPHHHAHVRYYYIQSPGLLLPSLYLHLHLRTTHQGTSQVLRLSTGYPYEVLPLSTKPEVPCCAHGLRIPIAHMFVSVLLYCTSYFAHVLRSCTVLMYCSIALMYCAHVLPHVLPSCIALRRVITHVDFAYL